MNPGLQDGRRRRNHGAMVVTCNIVILKTGLSGIEATTLSTSAHKKLLFSITLLNFFKKWANRFVYFRSFQTTNTIFTTNQCEKMLKCPSSIWRRDSNPRPYVNESSPITTRPGLPPKALLTFDLKRFHSILFSNSYLRRTRGPIPT